MTLNLLELTFLRAAVDERIGLLQRSRARYLRMGAHTDQFYEKLALVESELKAMESIKSAVNDEIAMLKLF